MSIFFKSIIALLFISLLILHFVEADQLGQSNEAQISPSKYLQKMDCGGACIERCRLSSRPRLCKRACGTCCNRCNCVPPGTSGNHDVCPCYAALTTHGGKLKCP